MAQVLNRYPLWKYLLLIALVVFGLLYAAPNLFPEDPAVQISGSNTASISQAQVNIAKQTLDKAGIKYKDISLKDDKILIRLSYIDSELKAEELIQDAIGDDYTAAVNLVSATPKWLASIGGNPMKLGLDLRGGVHFLLQVDVESVIQKRERSDLQRIAKTLREEGIRYSRIRPQSTGLLIQFHTDAAQQQAETLLRGEFTDYQVAEIQRPGQPSNLQMSLQPAMLTQVRNDVMSQTIQVLNNRVNALGVAEAVVARQGLDRISVDLPGVQDTTQASLILGGNATLEMRLVNENADISSAQQGIVPAGSSLYHTLDGRPIVLYNKIILTGDAITRAKAGIDERSATPSVTITAVGPQVPEFHRITGRNIGKRMGIILINSKTETTIVNGKEQHKVVKEALVVNDAVIQNALPGTFQVMGLSSTQMAKNLAIQLRSGTTPAALFPQQELLVGPSLGKANIEHGVWSVLAGFLMIIGFMLLYYRLFGLIANIALFTNLVLTIAVMSIVGFTLSLPGIAGMVLAVGMAVDANVLIFERIREELRNGNTPQAAIHAGYERAFTTIVDSNVTTLIIAILLFAVATSTVKAFAITLIIGLLISMITAIIGTRALVNLIYGGRAVKKLSIGIKMKGK